MADFAGTPSGSRKSGEPTPPPASPLPDPTVGQQEPQPAPAGDVYDWYVRGRELLARGDAAAAAAVLSHTVAAEPQSRSAREMLARAQFDARHFADAADNFAQLVASDPADHYAHFGLGLAARRVGDLSTAVEHLALATAMRPDLAHYAQALRAARAAAARR
jgi:tetratricopeptide (TPR) repeat protein